MFRKEFFTNQSIMGRGGPYLKRKRAVFNDGLNPDNMDSTAATAGGPEDAYEALMGVDQADKQNIAGDNTHRKGPVKDRRLQVDEQHDKDGWKMKSICPPNKLMVQLKYRDQFTQQPVTNTSVYEQTLVYNVNALYAPNNQNYALGAGTYTEPIPWLQAYCGIWNRALVLRAQYKVTFINVTSGASGVLKAYIGFAPYGQSLVIANSTSTWAQKDAQFNAEANSKWITTNSLGPSTMPQSHLTMTFGKYLPEVYGDYDQYASTLDNTVSGSPNNTVDFTQQFLVNNGLGQLVYNPLTILTASVGVMTTAPTDTTITCYMLVSSTLSTMMFRSNLAFY